MKTKNTERLESNYFSSGIAKLSPAYFSLVMATGIVAIGTHLYAFERFALALFYISISAYAILCCLFCVRLFYYPKAFLTDFLDHRTNMGFLSFVAGNCILGSEFILISNSYTPGIFFFFIGLVSWLLLTYSLFAVLTVKSEKPTLDKAISGAWLLIIVATQSVAVLGTQLQSHLQFFPGGILFTALILFLCGGMFYIIVITLIFYRLTFFEIHAEEFAPPYWINMGAVAITTLAGAMLILQAKEWPFLVELLPFLKGFTLFFWAIGTWWIPLMVVLGIWRHILQKMPLKYHPQYWGMVFPLGMYTVSTLKLSQALKLPFLRTIPSIFIYIAVSTWVVVFLGMIYALGKAARQKAQRRQD